MIPREYINIPNALSMIRLLGVPLLFIFVHFESPLWFVCWFIFLGFTDYFDGLLARRWNQTTDFGSMLDAVADVAYYISAAWFLIYLFPEYLVPNIPYVVFCIVIFGFSMLISQLKIGKILFLHTHLSRSSGVLFFFGVLASFFMDTTLVIRFIVFTYTVAFIEVSIILWIYGEVSPDTRTIFELRRKQNDANNILQ
ncbi:MAG: CDP-alcohol phosphatidyltransferase family protein [Balneolaceae bacterium]|nr:MAG: CDP-alcohol phosphatidyltransferase family protein [Balneolaceae bacterium]